MNTFGIFFLEASAGCCHTLRHSMNTCHNFITAITLASEKVMMAVFWILFNKGKHGKSSVLLSYIFSYCALANHNIYYG